MTVSRIRWQPPVRAKDWCATVLLTLALGACSGSPPDGPQSGREDPLKNTKALVLRGHKSLYDNGALQLPYTTVKLIPRGPDWEDVALDSARNSAGAAFYLNLEQAKEALSIVSDGTRYSFQVATAISRETSEVVAAIRAYSRPNAKLIANKGDLAGAGIRGESWTLGAAAEGSIAQFGTDLRLGAARTGDRAAGAGADWIQATPALMDAIIDKSFARGDAVGSSLDASAERLSSRMHWQGRRLVLAGVDRLGSSPAAVSQSYHGAAQTGGSVQRSLESSGQGLRESSAALGDRLTDQGAAMAGAAVTTGRETYAGIAAHAPTAGNAVEQSGQSLAQSSSQTGSRIARAGTRRGKETISGSQIAAGTSFREGMGRSGQYFSKAGATLVLGYAALPEKVSGRFGQVQVKEGKERLSARLDEREAWRAEHSDVFTGVLTETRDSYTDNVRLKFDKAGETYRQNVQTSGMTLAAFKAIALVMQGIVWEGALRPAGKATGALVGYVAVNGVIYPALVAVEGGRFTANLAVEVTQATAGAGYDVVAPSGTAAVAATLGLANAALATGKTAVLGGGGTLLGTADVAASNVAGRAVQAGGTVTGKTIEYIGVPLVQTGVHLGAGAAGVVSGTSAMLGGVGLVAAGQTVKGGGSAAGATVEHGVAPVANATVQGAGVVGGLGKGLFEEAAGLVLVATGGVVQGGALAAETTLKYGVSPVSEGAVKAGGVVASGVAGAGQATGGAAVYLWGKSVKTSGWVAGRTVQHGAAPVVMAGIVATGATAGVATQGSGRLAQGALYGAGEAAAGVTWVFGNTLADATVAGGAIGSAAYGSAVTLYEVAQSVVVPVGHIGGAGIALGYKSISQLAAHSLLGVADASYLVLSLEGPRWVLYAVKGNLGSGEDLPAGAVVDLKTLQEHGEVIYNVPISDGEMRQVIDAMQEDFRPDPAAQP